MAIYAKEHKRTGVLWYYVRVVGPDGRRIKVKAGTTEKQAIKREKILLGQIAAGEYVDPRKVKADSITLGDFLDRFERDYASRTRSDYYAERCKILRAYFGGDRVLAQITRDDIDRFRAARERGTVHGFAPAGPSTVKKDLTALGTIFKMAVRWGALGASPAVDIDKPREPRPAPRPLTVTEYQKVRDAAPPWLRPVVRFAVVTGLRLKEIVTLRWDDVDMDEAVLHLGTDNKTETGRRLPLGGVAREVLEGARTRFRGGFVFQDSEGNPYTSQRARNRISKTFAALLVGNGLRAKGEGRRLAKGPSLKTLRTTAASWAGKCEYTDTMIGEFLGHSRGRSMTARYIGLSPDDLRPLVRDLDSAERGDVPWPAPQVDPVPETGSGEGDTLNGVSDLQKVGT